MKDYVGRGIYRSRQGAIFGVCRGLSEYFDFSVFWVRLIALVMLIVRATNGLVPGLEPVCPAAALPADPEALWFDPDRLLEVEITMQKADWDAMRVQERNLYAIFVNLRCGDEPFPDPYTYFHADVVVEGQPLADLGIRKKGFFGSLSQTKPSLKLDFGERLGPAPRGSRPHDAEQRAAGPGLR